MENILIALNNPTDDDIQQMEALYNSFVKSKTFESSEASCEAIEIQKENSILNLLVQKCFEKIGTDKDRYISLEREIDSLQQHVYRLQDENNYLGATNKEAFEKIGRLENVLDEVEANNHKLHEEVVHHRNEKIDLEASIQNQRGPIKENSNNVSIVEHNHLNTSSNSHCRETKLQYQADIKILVDTLDSQSQTIDHLREEVDKYQLMQSKYEDVKRTVTSLLDAKFTKLFSSQEKSTPRDKSRSHRKNRRSSIILPSSSNICVDDIDGGEGSNRNHLIGGASRLSKEGHNRNLNRQSSLVEDIIATEAAEGQKQYGSCCSLEKGLENTKKSSRRDYIATKKTAASLYDFENDKFDDQSPKRAVGSDLDDGYGDMYDRRIEDTDGDNTTREKGLVSWLEGDISKYDYRCMDSPLSVQSRKSHRRLRSQNRNSREFRASELESKTTDAETRDNKDSSDSNEGKIEDKKFETPQERTKDGEFASFSFGRFENKSVNQRLDAKEAYRKLDKQVKSYVKSQKTDAKTHTNFSVTGIIRVLVFGAPKAV